MSEKNYLRCADIELHIGRENNHRKLPYPLTELQVGEDKCIKYDIPEEDMQSVLDEINPLQNVVTLNAEETRFDMFRSRSFKLKNCMVLWYRNTNLIVSPWFVEYGATLFYSPRKVRGLSGFHRPRSAKSLLG